MPSMPAISEADAVRRAAEQAAADGWKVDDYDAQPEYHDDEDRWIVWFVGKVPAPGNHFVAYVNGESGAVEVFPGR